MKKYRKHQEIRFLSAPPSMLSTKTSSKSHVSPSDVNNSQDSLSSYNRHMNLVVQTADVQQQHGRTAHLPDHEHVRVQADAILSGVQAEQRALERRQDRDRKMAKVRALNLEAFKRQTNSVMVDDRGLRKHTQRQPNVAERLRYTSTGNPRLSKLSLRKKPSALALPEPAGDDIASVAHSTYGERLSEMDKSLRILRAKVEEAMLEQQRAEDEVRKLHNNSAPPSQPMSPAIGPTQVFTGSSASTTFHANYTGWSPLMEHQLSPGLSGLLGDSEHMDELKI